MAWPVFIPRTQDLGHRVEVTFVCPACGEHGAVDENTRLCKKCWRPVAMLTQVLRMMRDKEMP